MEIDFEMLIAKDNLELELIEKEAYRRNVL